MEATASTRNAPLVYDPPPGQAGADVLQLSYMCEVITRQDGSLAREISSEFLTPELKAHLDADWLQKLVSELESIRAQGDLVQYIERFMREVRSRFSKEQSGSAVHAFVKLANQQARRFALPYPMELGVIAVHLFDSSGSSS